MVLLMIEVCARFNSPNIFCAPAWSVTTSRNFIRNKNANCGEKHGKKTHATKQTSFTWRFVQTPFFQYAFYRHSLRLTCYLATTAKGKEYLRNFAFKQKRQKNSPGDILLSHFSPHTRPHSLLAPQSDVTEPGEAHSSSWKSWHSVVNLVFGRFQDRQRGNNLVKAAYWRTSLSQSNTVNNSIFFGRKLYASYHSCFYTCTAD